MSSTQLRHVTLLAIVAAVVITLLSISTGAGAVGGASPAVETPAENGDQSIEALDSPITEQSNTGPQFADSIGLVDITSHNHINQIDFDTCPGRNK